MGSTLEQNGPFKKGLNMRNLLLATTAIFAFAGTANAFDLGNGFRLDNTVEFVYSVETQTFTSTYEPELSYAFAPDWRVFALTEFDLQDINFEGLELGIEWAPAAYSFATFTATAFFDNGMNYTDIEVMLEIRF
jgi:hypothetical protein